MTIFNKTSSINNRKKLRSNMVKAEIVLWSKLKNGQLNNLKFRRQHGIGNYIVDFYCPELKLILEIDGPTHEFSFEKDKERDVFFGNLNLKIVRFTNDDIYCRLNEVLEKILEYRKYLQTQK